MKKSRLPLLLLLILVISTCVLLFSTHSNTKNYILEGQVHCPDGSPVSLDIYVTQEAEFPPAFTGLHRVRTVEQGKFTTEFHAEVNLPIHFYIVKNGLTPVKHTFYPKAENGRNQRLGNPILFTAIHEKLGSEHHYGDKGVPKLPTFGHRCGQKPLSFIPVDEIVFVENLSFINCGGNASPNLEGNIKTRKQLFANTFFRQLPVGGAYNAASTSSPLSENNRD